MWMHDYNSTADNPFSQEPFVRICYLSYSDNLPDWSYAYHCHEDRYELTFVVESSGQLLLENDKIALKAGDIIIMPPNTLHCYSCKKQEAMRYYAFFVDVEEGRGEIQEFLREIRDKPTIVSAYKYLDYIRSSFQILTELHQINQGVIDGTYQTICLGMFMLIKKVYQNKAMAVPIGSSSYASDVLWYIHQHYSEELSLEELAKQFNISASHLRRIFKQVYDISPINYLIKHRIATAADYLLKTDLSVAEVARQVGYENTTHFSHLFADRIGCTPSEVRERHQKSPVLRTISRDNMDRE